MKGDSRSKVNVNKSEVAGRIVAGSATIHAAIVVRNTCTKGYSSTLKKNDLVPNR